MNEIDLSSKERNERPWDNREILERLYHEKGLSQGDIADELGCSRSTVHYSMVRNGVQRRGWLDSRRVEYARFRTQQHGYEVWETRVGDTTKQCRVHQLLAIANGADPSEIFGGSHIHHKNNVPWDNRDSNIEVLTLTEHNKLHQEEAHNGAPWRDRDLMEKLYADEERTISEIAEEFGCSPGTVIEWARKHGFSKRDHKNSPWRDKEVLERLYVENELTTPQVGERLGCCAATVWKWLQNHDIALRENPVREGGR